MKRRSFLKLSAGASAATVSTPLLAGSSNDCPSAGPMIRPSGNVYVPGYIPAAASLEGMPALSHPRAARAIPKGYKGAVRLLTRLGLDGDIDQAVFPVKGHDVDISPDGTVGFIGSMEQASYVAFAPQSLDLISIGKPFRDGWVGGGHGAFVDNGAVLAVSERAPKVGYKDAPGKHYGRITLRDPETLKVLESYSSHGVSPHDIRLLPDGRHLVIANYGSTFPKGGRSYGIPRHIVEPSVTIIDIADGRQVAKYVSGSEDMELRHVCAGDLETIFAIQTRMGRAGDDAAARQADMVAYEPDMTVSPQESYLPAPTLQVAGMRALGSPDMQRLMRHGLSIHYEPIHQEVIATYPSSHSVMVFDAQSGGLKRHIDCAAIGLDYPSGLVLLRDDRHYAVTGFWKNLFIFERGTHRLMRELCHYTTLFGHSHITAH